MKIVISILIWIAGVVITAAAFLSSLIIKKMPFQVANRERLVHAQCFWWADALVAMNPFWKIKVEGLENIDHNKTYVVVANHQSFADIIIIYKTHMYFKWVAKKSLLKLPFIGGLLWVNDHIMLSRGEFGSIKKVYRQAAERLRSGVSMLFFPEGTRSGTDDMNEFQNGAFKLAIREKKPLLPVFIGGTREAIPKGGWIFKTKVSGRLVIFPPIDTSSYRIADFAALRDLVRGKLQDTAGEDEKI
ncbi:MAG: lysophospholipid acyltransferase family protein [Candidatus Omnitrophota bacterium]|nr:lysophospholipid acyltransferase family protein [Candidatus Omnitrophota bacterium]